MRETEALVARITNINDDVQHIELSVDESLQRMKPGQSFLARLDPERERWDPYLRERWWAVNVRQGQIIVERPASETYDVGQVISLLGLIGQPFRFRRTLRNVLLVAYDTLPTPLLMTIPWLVGNKIAVTLVLLGDARDYDTAHISPEVEVIRGTDESDLLMWDNQVMTMGWADQIFVVVNQFDEPKNFRVVLNKFRELRAEIAKNYLFGVFRPVLPCGAGACQACLLTTRNGTATTCLEGPAFDLTQIVLPNPD